MSLPISTGGGSPQKGDDIAFTNWPGITARVAWTLHIHSIPVTEENLDAARANAIMQIRRTENVFRSEDLAEHYTTSLICRHQRKRQNDDFPHDITVSLSQSWRDALHAQAQANIDNVLRLHYGHHQTTQKCAETTNTELLLINAGVDAIREIVVQAANADGFPLDDWSNARIDRLLRRLVAVPPEYCPKTIIIGDDLHAEHRRHCVRCDRVISLLKQEVLSPDDLVPPMNYRPLQEVSVLAWQSSLSAILHRRRLEHSNNLNKTVLSADTILFDLADPEMLANTLHDAASKGQPALTQMRGVQITDVGAWSSLGLIGPIPNCAPNLLEAIPFGQVQGFDNLPSVAKRPTSAKRLLLLLVTALLVAATIGLYTNQPEPTLPTFPISAQFTGGGGGIWIDFGVHDDAFITFFVEQNGQIIQKFNSQYTNSKDLIATGDGRYRLHLKDIDALLAISGDEPFTPNTELLSDISSTGSLEDFKRWVTNGHPRYDVAIHRKNDATP
jgi:hypothetical protein